ncbi:MAG: DUF3311 domain-containing protein [Terriglobales bacterium]
MKWKLLLGLPYIFLLWVPLYARTAPAWLGIPFFYWYLFGWTLLSAAITALVHSKTGHKAAKP